MFGMEFWLSDIMGQEEALVVAGCGFGEAGRSRAGRL